MKKISFIGALVFILNISLIPIQAMAEYQNEMILLPSEEMPQSPSGEIQTYIELQNQQMAAEWARAEEARIEEIRVENPDKYNQMMDQRAQQEHIRLVIEEHAKGELPSESARYQLAEWMHDDVVAQLSSDDDELDRLHKRIAKLEQRKENPNDYLMQRVDEILGLVQPEHDEFMPSF